MKSKWAIAAFTLIFATACGKNEQNVPATKVGQETEPAQVAAHEVTFETLVNDLGAADASTKQAAKKFLATVPYQRREWLRGRALAVLDPDVRSDLIARLEEIEEMLATNPPPISLHVKDASLGDVVAALNAEMGTHMRYNAPRVARAGTYTLDVTDLPLWEVVAKLNQQRPFQITPINPGLELFVLDAAEGMNVHTISGPFFMWAAARQLSPTTPPSFMVVYNIVSDPRMTINDLSIGSEAAAGVDSAGNEFKVMSRSGGSSSAAVGCAATLQLVWPATPGVTISRLKTSVTFTTAVPGTALTVDGIDSQPGWESQIDDVKVGVPRFNVQGQRIEVQCQALPVEKAALVTFRFLDKDGSPRMAVSGTRAAADGKITGWIDFPQPPYRLEVSMARRVHAHRLELELKDIPMPAR